MIALGNEVQFDDNGATECHHRLELRLVLRCRPSGYSRWDSRLVALAEGDKRHLIHKFLLVVTAIVFCAGEALGQPTGASLNLVQMARQKFTTPPLSEAEERVVQHASDGTMADCRYLGGGGDPANADGTREAPDEKWPETRNVRADLIRWLVVDREARQLIDPRGILIQGARITGNLDLSYTKVLFPLFLVGCRLEQPLNLLAAKMTTLSLAGSWTEAISADGLKLDGAIFLREGFHAEGEVRLPGAIIAGVLDATGGTFENLSGIALIADGIKVAGGVYLGSGFTAQGEVRMQGATVGGDLDATGGKFENTKGEALDAERAKVTGSVFLRNGFSAKGETWLLGVTIGGDLDANGGTFKNLKSEENPGATGRALSADNIKVARNIFLTNGFSAEGETLLLGAITGGDLEATDGTFKNPNGNALSADRIRVNGNVFLNDKFVAEGEVRLPAATIGGELSALNGTFKNQKGIALLADGINVTGGIFLGNGFSAEGGVQFPDAIIVSNLDARGGTFRNPGGDALSADRINVRGSVLVGDGFSAEGEVLLRNATIGGNLEANGGTFKNLKSDENPNPTEHALGADRIAVTGNVFLTNGFSVEGEVRLPNATIGGNLEATGGTFKNPSGNALIADRIEVSGNVFLNDKFLAEGPLQLPEAEIKGQLVVNDASLDELDLESAHIAGPFFWRRIDIRAWQKGSPTLDLNGAKVGALDDDQASWPRKGGLILDGFVYDRIVGGPTDANARLRWLGLQPDGYLPQPYEQLTTVLRQMGHEDQIAEVAIDKQKDLYAYGGLGWKDKLQNWFLFLVVGYGYGPLLPFVWLALLVLAGTVVFLWARLRSVPVMVPSDKEAYESDEKAEKIPLPHYYPKFNAFVYSLDVIFPFDLGQKSRWHLSEKQSGTLAYWIFEGYSLFQLIAGWVLLLVAAAVPAGLIK